MEKRIVKLYAKNNTVPLKVVPGHFATNHAHTNYYIDLTTIKSRVSEAQEIARALVHMYLYDMVVDTIVCMEGTEVIGTLLAEELTKGGFLSLNAHKTIYIIKPEFNSNSQIMFKDNFRPMLNGKNVILLTATVTTGLTINKGIEGIQYYGGIIQSVSAVFSALDEMNGIPIKSVFGKRELPLDIGFGKASDHILPMIFRLTGNVLDQTANIENVIFLLFSHGYVHSFQTSGNAEH